MSLCLFACNGNNNAFKVIDTGIHVYTGLEWKDDSQIFYVEKKYIDEEKKEYKKNLVLLNILTGEKKVVFEDIVRYCFNQGRLIITQKGQYKNETNFFVGSIDRLTKKKAYDKYYRIYGMPCRLKIGDAPYGSEQNRYWTALPNDLGFLDTGQILPYGTPSNQNFTYIPNKNSIMEEAVYFDVSYKDMNYNEFVVDNIKLFINSSNTSNYIDEQGEVYRYGYWFKPPHSLEKKYYKISNKTKNVIVYFYPIKQGRAVVKTRVYSQGRAHYALSISPDFVDREMIKGDIKEVSVSPDGCKVAFIHSKVKTPIRLTNNFEKTLKYINVCNRKKLEGEAE